MRYPNLSWILAYERIPQYALCEVLKTSEAHVCRKLSGRAEVAPHEKQRIAEFLHYSQEWLFAEIVPPPSVRLQPAVAQAVTA